MRSGRFLGSITATMPPLAPENAASAISEQEDVIRACGAHHILLAGFALRAQPELHLPTRFTA